MAFSTEWFSSLVYVGDQLGRTINFPTLNLLVDVLPTNTEHGVYVAKILYEGQQYAGALFYGQRKVLQEDILVLEIFVLDFDQEIYGETVSFQLCEFIRPVYDFTSFTEMKHQLAEDVLAVKKFVDT